MSIALNPTSVKRREYLGLLASVSGALLCLISLIGFVAGWGYMGLMLGLGVISLLVGMAILVTIPDLVHTPDESF